MKLLVLSIGASFVQVPSIILRYIPFSNETIKEQKKLLTWIYAIILVINSVIFWIIAENGLLTVGFYKKDLLLICVVLAITNSIVIRKRYMEHIFVFGITEILVIMLLTVISYTEAQLKIENLEILIIIHEVVFGLVFLALYPWLKRLLINTITPFLKTDSREYWKNICLAPTAMFFAITIAFPMDQYIQTSTAMFCRCLISVATLCLCRGVAYDYEMMEKREALSQSLNEQKEYFSALASKVQETRRARHDLRHHLTVISSWAKTGDVNQIEEYCEKLLNTGISEPLVPFSGNSVVDGIIYHYMQLCKKEDIQFKNCGVLKIKGISDADLCVLLGNALENAYTACKKMDALKFINLYFQTDVGYLAITVENSFDGQLKVKNNQLLSLKRKNEPGIGLQSMKDICKKYDGELMVNHTKTMFQVMCLLKISAIEKDIKTEGKI